MAVNNENTISNEQLDQSELLSILYDNAKPLGMGFLHYEPKSIGKKKAQINNMYWN